MENRKFERHPLPCQINCPDEPSFAAQVLDISQTGLKISADRALPKGTVVNIELYLTPTDPFPIRIIGESVWSAQIGDEQNCPIVMSLDLAKTHPRNLRVLNNHIKSATTGS